MKHHSFQGRLRRVRRGHTRRYRFHLQVTRIPIVHRGEARSRRLNRGRGCAQRTNSARGKTIAKLENIKSMVYSISRRWLSRQSPARVHAHNDYEAVDNLRDPPNRLLQIVMLTELLYDREKDTQTARKNVQKSLSQSRMQLLETLRILKLDLNSACKSIPPHG